MPYRWVLGFEEIGANDVARVGGKNASLGEMTRELVARGLRVPPGFAITAGAYRRFLEAGGIAKEIDDTLAARARDSSADLDERSARIRALILAAPMPGDIADEISAAYGELSRGGDVDVAVRSSATAEDLPEASFAGQQESFLNVRGAAGVVEAVKRAYASLFSPRAIHYREDMGFEHRDVALSVGVQRMVRSDLASAGVVFTLDPDSGHRGVVLVTSSLGLGESVVQGRVAPDQFFVHKEALREGFRPLVWKKLGTKETRIVYDPDAPQGVRMEPVDERERARWSLTDDEILELARAALVIEDHYSRRHGEPTPMDIEWAKDGRTGELFIVQARPETVHSRRRGPSLRVYRLLSRGEVVAVGLAIGDRIASGAARVVRSPAELSQVRPGDILVTEATDPDWEPVMKRSAGIVTERGGRTSHAAIVARELGLPAVVGATGAMAALGGEGAVTISCAEGSSGRVYRGALEFTTEEVDASHLPRPRTKVMLNVADPEKAFGTSLLPNDGVGLARMEFIFAGWVKVHPLALTRFDTLAPDVRREVEALTAGYDDKSEYFVDRLAQGIGTLAAAFHPRPVILRFSDFKTNEYARLLGGSGFEPSEENPMLGWRGASRYYHEAYREGFLLEVAAVRRVREVFGLRNLMVMVPFCRTPEEGRRVLATMRDAGLVRGRDGLEVYVMAEIPSNIILAEEFARDFDGFSIGSNDLTQLTLGIDRDSATVAPLFDEQNDAVKWSCARLIELAHRHGCKAGICGQAPSDFPEFAAFLVERGIDSISLTPDAIVRAIVRIAQAEDELGRAPRAGPFEGAAPALH